MLDIDALNKDTLRKLRDFVSPKSTIKTKKRKSNYSAKERRIQELEKTLEKFNQADPNYRKYIRYGAWIECQ